MSTPNTKVNSLARAIIEVITQQLNENFSNLTTDQEKRVFMRVLSGEIVKKYNTFSEEMKMKPLSKLGKKLGLIDINRSSRKICEDLKTIDFVQEKKDYITKKGDRKQKGVMLDTLLNLYKRFVEKAHIKISYPMFCNLQPFWIVQPRCDCVHFDFTLKSLYNSKIISVSNYMDLLNQVCCNRFYKPFISEDPDCCNDADISKKAAILGCTEGIRTFSGTLKVHQVTVL
ncbi:unnamed protein product [Leptidea sinapis]|uniref:Uncharacterized protein n=1 Tax=Leptidea sinapis TaxID=189913 RepID=A0A5E4PPV6_9NEOP|nr:unnamed protein product [Leptidea sinapis]